MVSNVDAKSGALERFRQMAATTPAFLGQGHRVFLVVLVIGGFGIQ